MASLLKIRLRRSTSKCTPRQVGTLHGLGLFNVGQEKVLKDTAPIRGMVLRMQHMVDVERLDGDEGQRTSARLRTQRA